MEDRPVEVNHPIEENPRVKQLETKERFMSDENGKPHSKIKTYAYNITQSQFKWS